MVKLCAGELEQSQLTNHDICTKLHFWPNGAKCYHQIQLETNGWNKNGVKRRLKKQSNEERRLKHCQKYADPEVAAKVNTTRNEQRRKKRLEETTEESEQRGLKHRQNYWSAEEDLWWLLIKPTTAPNWSKITQQSEARHYLPLPITTGGGLEDDGSKDPPLAPLWIDQRGTGRPPPAPNWMSRDFVWPPPAPNWHINNSHRSHLHNKTTSPLFR
jgi:hypothetical protein